MVDDSKILNIDYLKANNTRLYYFGLGFIQLVFNKYQRIHFYNAKLEQTNDEIHNHRYNFTSKIIKGNFLQKKFNLIAGDTHILKNETCGKDIVIPPCIVPLSVIEIENKVFKEGDVYHITFNEFHTVSHNCNTITFLTRSDVITDYAQVVYEKDKELICPFSTKLEEKILWEMIEDTINNE